MTPDIVVMTRNSAAHLPDCLHSLQGVGPVWVVDSASCDDTARIATATGARVVPFCWDGHYPKKKQWSVQTLPFAGDWVLFVDADERMTPGLAAELGSLPADPAQAAFFVTLNIRLFGQTLQFGRKHRKITLLHRHRARFLPCADLDIPMAWEVEGHYQPQLDGPAGHLKAAMVHEYARTEAEWIALCQRHWRYARWTKAMQEKGKLWQWQVTEASWLRRCGKWALRCLPGAGWLAWADSAVLRLGFLDGSNGLRLAGLRRDYYMALQQASPRAFGVLSDSD